MKKKYLIFNYLRFPESLKNTFDRCLFIFCFRSGNNLVVPKNLQHYCRVCNTQLNSCVQAKIHSQGKKHDKRVSYLRFCLESSKFPFTLCTNVRSQYNSIGTSKHASPFSRYGKLVVKLTPHQAFQIFFGRHRIQSDVSENVQSQVRAHIQASK